MELSTRKTVTTVVGTMVATAAVVFGGTIGISKIMTGTCLSHGQFKFIADCEKGIRGINNLNSIQDLKNKVLDIVKQYMPFLTVIEGDLKEDKNTVILSSDDKNFKLQLDIKVKKNKENKYSVSSAHIVNPKK